MDKDNYREELNKQSGMETPAPDAEAPAQDTESSIQEPELLNQEPEVSKAASTLMYGATILAIAVTK